MELEMSIGDGPLDARRRKANQSAHYDSLRQDETN